MTRNDELQEDEIQDDALSEAASVSFGMEIYRDQGAASGTVKYEAPLDICFGVVNFQGHGWR